VLVLEILPCDSLLSEPDCTFVRNVGRTVLNDGVRANNPPDCAICDLLHHSQRQRRLEGRVQNQYLSDGLLPCSKFNLALAQLNSRRPELH
jgi:hypothetical protein